MIGDRSGIVSGMNKWWKPLLEPDGLLLRDRVLAADVDPDDILIALRSCRIRRIQRGVYAPRSVELRPLAYARAAIISSGEPDAVASHLTAARVHGLARPSGTHPEYVTVGRRHRRRERRDLHFHGRPLALREVRVLDDVPVTSVARTLADLAGSLDRLFAVWIIDDAIRRDLCEPAEVQAAADRWSGGGAGRARQRVAEADGMSESVLETAGRLALLDAGLPPTRAQYVLRDRSGAMVARLDGAYEEERIGIEYDGKGPHSAPSAVFHDRHRQNAVSALGWTVLRYTWWDVVHDRERFVASVRSGLRQAKERRVGGT